MIPLPPTSLPKRSDRGPLWLSRSLVISAAVWLVMLGAALGTCFALTNAWRDIRQQGFVELGFSRSLFTALEQAADRGALQGAMTALSFLILGLLVAAYAPVRVLFDPRELAELLVNRDRLLRAQVVVALAFLIATIALACMNPGLTRAQAYLLGSCAAIGILALAVIAGFLRRLIRANDPTAEATAFAACAAAAVVALLGFTVDSERIWKPFAGETIVANLLLLSGALCTFQLTRGAILYSNRVRAPAPRGALGGSLVRAGLVALILPALAPIFVRAAANIFGHSGVTPQSKLNVIVIGIDTLRADSVDLVQPKNGARDRTPNLRKLAARGVQFRQAISQSPWTMPAFASIFTGKYPLEHGAVSLSGRLRNREVTLPEILREAGYRTASFVSNDYTDHKHGFLQGNEVFKEDFVLSPDEISSQGITNEAIAFVEGHASDHFFMFAHYMDPHYEYRDHKGWNWADDYSGWWKKQLDIDNLVRNRNLIATPDLTWLRDLYDEEIAYTDSEIGRLLTALEKSKAMGRTIIIVVADHGEEFLEHGNLSHTTTLYEELLHVPMIVVLPGMEADSGTQREDVVETRRVFSTVLERLGIDFAADTRPKGLFADVATATGAPQSGAARETADGKAFSMLWLPDAQPKWGKRFQIASLRTARWKLIYNITRDTYELFDLSADPGEKLEVSAAHAQEFADLRHELDSWIAQQEVHAGDLPRTGANDEHTARLRALGYM